MTPNAMIEKIRAAAPDLASMLAVLREFEAPLHPVVADYLGAYCPSWRYRLGHSAVRAALETNPGDHSFSFRAAKGVIALREEEWTAFNWAPGTSVETFFPTDYARKHRWTWRPLLQSIDVASRRTFAEDLARTRDPVCQLFLEVL